MDKTWPNSDSHAYIIIVYLLLFPTPYHRFPVFPKKGPLLKPPPSPAVQIRPGASEVPYSRERVAAAHDMYVYCKYTASTTTIRPGAQWSWFGRNVYNIYLYIHIYTDIYIHTYINNTKSYGIMRYDRTLYKE